VSAAEPALAVDLPLARLQLAGQDAQQ